MASRSMPPSRLPKPTAVKASTPDVASRPAAVVPFPSVADRGRKTGPSPQLHNERGDLQDIDWSGESSSPVTVPPLSLPKQRQIAGPCYRESPSPSAESSGSDGEVNMPDSGSERDDAPANHFTPLSPGSLSSFQASIAISALPGNRRGSAAPPEEGDAANESSRLASARQFNPLEVAIPCHDSSTPTMVFRSPSSRTPSPTCSPFQPSYDWQGSLSPTLSPTPSLSPSPSPSEAFLTIPKARGRRSSRSRSGIVRKDKRTLEMTLKQYEAFVACEDAALHLEVEGDKTRRREGSDGAPFSLPSQPLSGLNAEDLEKLCDEEESGVEWIDMDFLSSLEEPSHGMHPAAVDLGEYENKREGVACYPYIPFIFAHVPLRPEEEIPDTEKLQSFEQLHALTQKGVDASSITFIFLADTAINPKLKKNFGKLISHFQNCEIMVLQNLGLQRVGDMTLPKLRRCDMRCNLLDDPKDLLKMVKRSPELEVLDVTENPVNDTAQWFLPVIAHSHRLRSLNTRPLALEDHVHCIEELNKKDIRAELPMVMWDWSVSMLPHIHVMPSWSPHLVEELVLRSLGLSVLHVGALTNLRILDLADNVLTTILGTGLEKCTSLQVLNLSSNLLSRSSELRIFGMLPGLRELHLGDNHFGNTSDYRLQVLFFTRYLPGSNRSLGLTELDGEPVSMEERIQAVRTVGKLSPADVNAYHWNLLLISHYGHHQIRNVPAFFEHIRVVAFSGVGLIAAPLSKFTGVEVLDLSDNALTTVMGLEGMTRLRVLNLSGNKRLHLEDILSNLKGITTLRSVWLAQNDGTAFDPKYRTYVVASLAFHNHDLRWLDGRVISLEERVTAFRNRDNSLSDVEAFRFQLALVEACVPFECQCLHPTEVKNFKDQFDPESIHEIFSLVGLGLTAAHCDFTLFTMLEVLNLASNKINTLEGMGLEELSHLRVLDVRDNIIVEPLNKLGQVLDKMKGLEVVCLRGNPCMNEKNARSRLIASIPGLLEVENTLRVIDTELTLNERVEAWKAIGTEDNRAEELRFRAALMRRTPKDMPPDMVHELDLSGLDLHTIDMTAFLNLEVLSLKSNRLSSLERSGIATLKKLRLLDLRYNNISSIEEATILLHALPELVSVGFVGNTFSPESKAAKYRKKLILGCHRLRQIRCPLRYLDEQLISTNEIIDGWKKDGGETLDYEVFRFDITVFRRVPSGIPYEEIQELDLSSGSLSILMLRPFVSLRRLSLRNNHLTCPEIFDSGLDQLKFLEALDIRENHIRDIQLLASLINTLNTLKGVWVSGNPSFPTNTHEYRVKLLSKVSSMAKLVSTLEFLDGDEIDVVERCEALESGNLLPDKSQLDGLRLQLALDWTYASKESRSLNLSGYVLRDVSTLHEQFTHVKTLDLSYNALETLEGQMLHKLPLLKFLDLRTNRLASLLTSITQLEKCNALTHLFLQDSHALGVTQNGEQYIALVCDRLRGLREIDGQPNPTPLTKKQREAVRFLNKIGGVGPNTLVNIDISHRDLQTNQFSKVVGALSVLPVRHLVAKDNPWQRVRYYRLKLIHYIETLQRVDGVDISMDERANALKQLGSKPIKMKKKQKRPKVLLEGLPPENDAELMLVSAETPHTPTINGAIRAEATVDAIDLEGPEKIDSADLQNPAEGAEWRIAEKYVERGLAAERHKSAGPAITMRTARDGVDEIMAQGYGTILSKWEIIINFFQIYGLVLTFQIPWPDLWYTITEWAEVISLDINFLFDFNVTFAQSLQFGYFMAIPLVFLLLYRWKLKKDKWEGRLLEHWNRTRCVSVIFWLGSLLLATVFGFLLDHPTSFDRICDGKPATAKTNSIICVLGCTFTVLWGVFLLVARTVRKRLDEPAFWYILVKWKKRICLFALAILYMPIARSILQNFKGEENADGECHLKYWPGEPCVTKFSSLELVHYVSVFFGTMYIAGIPLILRELIRNGTAEVERASNIGHELENLREFKESMTLRIRADPTVKSELKAEYKQKKREFSKIYVCAIRSYDSAQSYLYNSYERPFKYFKVINMTEKLLLLGISSFLPIDVFGKLKTIAGCLVVGCFFTTSLFSWPFLDDAENFMDIFARFTNTLNFGCGLLLQNSLLSDMIGNAILLIANAINLFLMLFTLLGVTSFRWVRQMWRQRENKIVDNFQLKEHNVESNPISREYSKSDLGVLGAPAV